MSYSKIGHEIHRTLPKILLDCIRKSVILRKLCSEHKIYLCFRSTHCQVFKTIASPPAEISVIKKNKERVTVSIAITSGRQNFATSRTMLERFISENFVKNSFHFLVLELMENRSNKCPIRNSTRCLPLFSPE